LKIEKIEKIPKIEEKKENKKRFSIKITRKLSITAALSSLRT
jgi:hypothetical protein